MKKVLVIDDKADDLNVMTELLDNEGYACATALDLGGALAEVSKTNFDLILLDILMPASGYAVLKKLRKTVGRRSKIAYISIIPKDEADLNDADGFIQKPFSNEDFIAEVKRLLG